MTESVLFTILSLGSLGVISASVLYVVAWKFKVDEDPRIDVIDEILPGANCAGCGSPGCRAFAEKLVGSDDISTLFCPVGGNDTMKKVASILGKEVKAQKPQVAVLMCQGSCEVRPSITQYEGPSSCMLSSMIFSGETVVLDMEIVWMPVHSELCTWMKKHICR